MKKKLMRMGLLAAMCAAWLCVGALAAEGVGINHMTSESGVVTLTPLDSASNPIEEENTNPPEGVEVGYEEAAMVQVEVTDAQAGNYYLVVVLSDDTGVPTEDNIVYIDQRTAEDTTVTFQAYPSELTVGRTYYVYISSTVDELHQVGSYKAYSTVPYKLGDVNEDKAVNSTDAQWILQHTVGLRNPPLTANQKMAADVNKDSAVNSTDAQWVLQASVGLRDKDNDFVLK